jgi:Retrotransposon gag protein
MMPTKSTAPYPTSEEWLSTTLSQDDYAIVSWADNYSAFISHLHTNFRPFNVEANMENELEKLRTKENHKIAKYIVNFSQLDLLF